MISIVLLVIGAQWEIQTSNSQGALKFTLGMHNYRPEQAGQRIKRGGILLPPAQSAIADAQAKPMTTQPDNPDSAGNPIPEPWRLGAKALLAPDEHILAWLETDLDHQLRFAPGMLIATDRQLIAKAPGASEWQQWTYRDQLVLQHHDHAGVGMLELCDGASRLVTWRYTLGQNPPALRLMDKFKRSRDAGVEGGAPAPAPATFCPQCLAPLPGGEEDCPVCTREIKRPPSTWTLFRLSRFAKPYKGQLITGSLLTIAATIANLVPPYLSMPLMDKVLIPFQNGKPIDVMLVGLLLGGLFGSSLLAWGLGWARTYILALVSERISADLRTTTYQHLLHLSLEYFGGKRTGDLMSRIGSESDRISVFLSLHALDFVTDVLMILMTSIVLFSINPWLALVTLLPLPFIAWMIHVVRDRLRTGFEKIDRVWGEVTNVLADTIPGIRVVKAFAQEQREVKRFQQANRHNLQINDRINRTWSLFSPTVTLLTEVGLLFVWAFGIWQVSKNQITVGVLIAFIAYITRFYTRLDSMSRIVSVTQKAAAGAKRIFDILDHVSSVPEPASPVHLVEVSGAIEIRNIGFRYGNRAVIRDVNLCIAPGEMIGLVGHSGSGKSTLVNLICRFYDVSAGSIRVDDVDVRSLPVAEYRRNIGLVLQEPFLFFGCSAAPCATTSPMASRTQRAPRLLPRRALRMRTNSSCACRSVTIRWSASAANRSPAVNANASPSHARC